MDGNYCIRYAKDGYVIHRRRHCFVLLFILSQETSHPSACRSSRRDGDSSRLRCGWVPLGITPLPRYYAHRLIYGWKGYSRRLLLISASGMLTSLWSQREDRRAAHLTPFYLQVCTEQYILIRIGLFRYEMCLVNRSDVSSPMALLLESHSANMCAWDISIVRSGGTKAVIAFERSPV